MQEVLQDDLSLFAMPAFFVAILLEAFWSHRQGHGWYRGRDTFVSLSMLVASTLVELLPRMLAVGLMFKLHEISPLREVVGRQWWAWLLLFFLEDFTYYGFHRMNHEVRLLWAGHVNHHSSQYLNFGTALRQGVGERVHKFLFWLWLPLLGFDPYMIITAIGISLFYQFWIHTHVVKKLHPWVEAVFNTPSHHRVHHGSNIRYLDCNHGGILIIWDRWFGTFSPEVDEEPVIYGLTRNIDGDRVGTVLMHEYLSLWRDICAARNWGDRWRYLCLAPGWSHSGPDHRARVLRQQLHGEKPGT
ncbi:MAG: sterol desaturase family protein [Gammaproteobacteria bacterium]|nr:sterol desaturase family protein [Gammaproteobacteria bacterium]